MTAKITIDTHPGRLSYMTFAKIANADENLPSHPKVDEVADVQQEIDHVKEKSYSYIPELKRLKVTAL